MPSSSQMKGVFDIAGTVTDTNNISWHPIPHHHLAAEVPLTGDADPARRYIHTSPARKFYTGPSTPRRRQIIRGSGRRAFNKCLPAVRRP